MDMEVNCNLEDVKRVINSDEFAQFLLNNTTDFGAACFILQTLHDKVKEIENDNN